MPENQDHLKKIEKKISDMVRKILDDQGDLKAAKLVGFFITKGGLRTDTASLLAILPKIVKLLFDFGEVGLCIDILQEAIQCFPDDEKLKLRLKKLQDLENLNSVKPKTNKKTTSDESSYDLASEITNMDQILNTKVPFQDISTIADNDDISNQQTMLSTNFRRGEEKDKNEITLAPTPPPSATSADETLMSGIAISSVSGFQPMPKPKTTNLPPDVVANYPGLTLLSSRYEYVKMLGEGGMGGVFLATDRQLGRSVAIKFMNSACISNLEVAERFIREARAQAVASHPGIVAIYDVGTEGNPFIVMEYVEGKTLKDVIKKEGGFALKESVRLMILVAEALEYAHFKKIIHRDVKPDNIILDQFGKTRLLDFGLAKQEQAPSMTINSQIMGTPYYMSPEQINGEEVGPPTDIYAWGVMLYQMTTGIVPFSKGDILYHHVHSIPIPPNQIAMDISESLNRVILKSMEKEIVNRYQNFKEVLTDLHAITL